MKKYFPLSYKYLPRYYTPSKFIVKHNGHSLNIDSLEEIKFLDKELKNKRLDLNKKYSEKKRVALNKKHSIKKLQSLEKELKQNWACGTSTQEVFTLKSPFKKGEPKEQRRSDHFVNNAVLSRSCGSSLRRNASLKPYKWIDQCDSEWTTVPPPW